MCEETPICGQGSGSAGGPSVQPAGPGASPPPGGCPLLCGACLWVAPPVYTAALTRSHLSPSPVLCWCLASCKAPRSLVVCCFVFLLSLYCGLQVFSLFCICKLESAITVLHFEPLVCPHPGPGSFPQAPSSILSLPLLHNRGFRLTGPLLARSLSPPQPGLHSSVHPSGLSVLLSTDT